MSQHYQLKQINIKTGCKHVKLRTLGVVSPFPKIKLGILRYTQSKGVKKSKNSVFSLNLL
jgi:hypothetical protein